MIGSLGTEVWLVVDTAVIAVLLYLLWTSRRAYQAVGVRQMEKKIGALENEVRRLETLVEEFRLEREKLYRDLTEAHRHITNLQVSDKSLRLRVAELEGAAGAAAKVGGPLTPMLLIGAEEEHLQVAAAQLNRAHVWYRQLPPATADDVAQEMDRRRQNGDLYPWCVIIAHGSPEGIQLADGLAPPAFWNRVLEGVQVVMLTNCKSQRTGDWLAGVAPYVVVFYGDVLVDDAAAFMYSFWSEMMRSQSPHDAYRRALVECPQLRPFADLRVR